MPRWQHDKGPVATALAVLLVPLASSGCSDANIGSGDPSATARSSRASGAAVGASEVCLVGRATGEGIECQAFRADGDDLYTLIGDLGSLARDSEVCVCGEPVELSSCMQGTTIAVTLIGPPDTCP